MTTVPDIEHSQRGPLRRGALGLGRVISTVVYVYLVIVEIILGLGFFLLLFGANPTSSFVDWVYRSMDRAMRPFRGIFSTIELGSMPNEVEAVFDTSVLFAMIMYGILALVIHAVVDWLADRAARLEREDEEYRRYQVMMQAAAPVVPPARESLRMDPTAPAAPPAPTDLANPADPAGPAT